MVFNVQTHPGKFMSADGHTVYFNAEFRHLHRKAFEESRDKYKLHLKIYIYYDTSQVCNIFFWRDRVCVDSF